MSVITVSNQAVVDEAVRQFKERYESVSSQREMALLEQELWQQVRAHISASGSSAGRKQRWWDVALGGRNLASFRSAILMRGEPAQILWQYIDDKRITLRSAFRLLKLADQGKKSLDELIAEYLAMPDTTVRDGQIYRRRRRSAKQTVAETAPASTPPPPRAVAESDVDVGADDWRTARRTFEAVINHRIAGIAEPRRTHLRQEFKMEVDLLIESSSIAIIDHQTRAILRIGRDLDHSEPVGHIRARQDGQLQQLAQSSDDVIRQLVYAIHLYLLKSLSPLSGIGMSILELQSCPCWLG